MIYNEISVLIIDDAAVNLILLESILKKNGYEVFKANNGADGREIAKKERPGIILLDVMMPDEDGFETCQKLKQDSSTADIPVIFISSLNDSSSIVKGLTIGGIDYIRKPFQREEVLARVKNYLRLHYTYQRVIEEQASRLKQIQDAQQAILTDPDDFPEARFSIHYNPILEAGGDFYDVFEISADVYGYFVGDISGHDLSASYATSALKALICQNASPLYSPDETLRVVNSVLLSIFSPGQHMTAAYVTIDRKTSTLSYVNAGHLPVLYLSEKGDMQWLEGEGDILGAFSSAVYQLYTVKVEKGSRVFIFSDGLLESFDGRARSREEGMKELAEFAIKTQSFDLRDAIQKISKLMFEGNRKIEDDIVLLGIDI